LRWRRHLAQESTADMQICRSRPSIETSSDAHMWMPQQRLYAAMQRMVPDPALSLPFPSNRVFEIGTVVKL